MILYFFNLPIKWVNHEGYHSYNQVLGNGIHEWVIPSWISNRKLLPGCGFGVIVILLKLLQSWVWKVYAQQEDAPQNLIHDDVIKWRYFPRYWPFVRGIHRWPVNSPHKGQWRGALMFYLICARINAWVNNGEAGDLRRHRAHYNVIVMTYIMIHILFSDIPR